MWYVRKDGRKGEHLSCQVGQVSHHKDEARLDYLDVFGASGQKAHQYAKHHTQEGTTKGNHEKWNCNRRRKNETVSFKFSNWTILL